MKTTLLLPEIAGTGCVKESDPAGPLVITVSFIPGVSSSAIDYDRAGVEGRVPDSALFLACHRAYRSTWNS